LMLSNDFWLVMSNTNNTPIASRLIKRRGKGMKVVAACNRVAVEVVVVVVVVAAAAVEQSEYRGEKKEKMNNLARYRIKS